MHIKTGNATPWRFQLGGCQLIHHIGLGDGKCAFSVQLGRSRSADTTSFEQLACASFTVMDECIPQQGSGGIMIGLGA